jgi:hypothetical protein
VPLLIQSILLKGACPGKLIARSIEEYDVDSFFIDKYNQKSKRRGQDAKH